MENYDNQIRKYEIIIAILLGFCVLMIAVQLNLFKKNKKLQENLVKLENEKKIAKEKIIQRGYAEIAMWQSEIIAWHHIEEIMDYWIEKEYDLALEILEKNKMQDSQTLPFFYYLSSLGNMGKKYNQKAIDDMTKYIDSVPTSFRAYFKRAQLYLAEKNIDMAIQDLETCIHYNKEFVLAQELLNKIKNEKK